jgi:hypothetical protein
MRPDFTKPLVALRMQEAGILISDYGADLVSDKAASLGTFTTENPDSAGFCTLGTPTPVVLALPEVPAMPDGKGGVTEPLPSTSLGLAWSNVKFVVSPSLIGTEFAADLVYERDGCRASYTVAGVYPSVSCAQEVTGPDGKKTSVADEGLCSPCANGRPTGSAIGPDIDTACEPTAMLCLPKSAPPSLRTKPLVCSGVAPMTPDAGVATDVGSIDAGGAEARSPNGGDDAAVDGSVDRGSDGVLGADAGIGN